MPNTNLPEPDAKQLAHLEDHGYYIVRGALPRDEVMEVRGVIKDHIQRPEAEAQGEQADPMDPMEDDTPAARAARFRKLNRLGVDSPLLWSNIYLCDTLLGHARSILGDDLLVKFTSCFLKPARTGSATPWHQDNGLWRDDEVDPFNFWMAIDPAVRANGCLQFIPGSHREPLVDHVLYPSSIHGELPREVVARAKEKYGGVHHIELQPGDAVCWHSNLFHYSPPNPSDRSRIAVAGVVSSYRTSSQTPLHKTQHWCLKGGEVCRSFPPEVYTAPGEKADTPKHQPAEEPAAV
ncbi:MAG: phytanoyl-CoA dioxygenase family protein [Planctomycetota bacterium]